MVCGADGWRRSGVLLLLLSEALALLLFTVFPKNAMLDAGANKDDDCYYPRRGPWELSSEQAHRGPPGRRVKVRVRAKARVWVRTRARVRARVRLGPGPG